MVRSTVEAGDISFPTTSSLALKSTNSPIEWVWEALLPGVKRPEREFIANLKNASSYTSQP